MLVFALLLAPVLFDERHEMVGQDDHGTARLVVLGLACVWVAAPVLPDPPQGAVVAAGLPVEVLTPALIERVWNVRADVDVVDGVASIRFLRRSRAEAAGAP